MDTLKDQIQTFPNLINTSNKVSSGVFPALKRSELYTRIINNTDYLPDTATVSQRIYHIIQDIDYVVTCSHCGDSVNFQSYIKGYCTYCSTKCTANADAVKEKRKQTSLKNHGVEHFSNPGKTKQTKLERYGDTNYCNTDKITQTKLERYGDENYNNMTQNKATCQEKYGHDYYRQSEDSKRKNNESCLERYGDVNYNNRAQCKETSLNTYGVDNPAKSKEIKKKVIATNLERYNVKHTQQNPKIRAKTVNTILKRFGVRAPAQSHYSEDTKDILFNSDNFIKFATNKNKSHIAYLLNVDPKTISEYIKKYNCADILATYHASKWETLVAEYLDEMGITYEQNTRGIISPLELDFYLPDFNIAIELNGNYWHSELAGKKDKDYHFKKWLNCREKGIDLYSYFEDELIDNIDVIKSKLRYLVNKNKKVIGARKCSISVVLAKDEREFLTEHHIQGSSTARNKTIGAYYNDELVAVFSWMQRKKYLEITRFASDTKASYPGLFSKMMKHMITELSYTGEIVSFSNNGHSNGGVYKASGFQIDKILGGAYWYTKDYLVRENRQGYMKSKIAKKFGIDMTDKTEWQAMQELGYDRIWDSGKIKWVRTIVEISNLGG